MGQEDRNLDPITTHTRWRSPLTDTEPLDQPLPAPQWLAQLFPHTEAPDECAHRFRRIEAIEVPVGEATGGQVTVEFLHRVVTGEVETARARVFLPPQLRADPKAQLPLVCSVGYEAELDGAMALLSQGFVVSTPHAHGENPLGRGPNLDIALLHAVRALAFIDNERVMIQGGSAGGYTALMVAAEAFPVLCVMPDVPPVNWGYNAAYFCRNGEEATRIDPATGQPSMRVLHVVLPIGQAGVESLGSDTDGASWLMSSPLEHLETLTAPIQAVWSTADMLVPVDQVGPQFTRGRDAGLFPQSFTTDLNQLMKRPETRRTLMQALPDEVREVFVVPVPDAPVLEYEIEPDGPPAPIDLPFSPARTWSIVIIDEGPAEPDCGHFRYALTCSHEAFRAWALGRGLAAEQLTLEQLRRLMMRLQGAEYRPFTVQPEGCARPIDGVRLDFPEAERQDVTAGLMAFSRDGERAQRLAEFYGQLPGELKRLGEKLGGTPAAVEAALVAAKE